MRAHLNSTTGSFLPMQSLMVFSIIYQLRGGDGRMASHCPAGASAEPELRRSSAFAAGPTIVFGRPCTLVGDPNKGANDTANKVRGSISQCCAHAKADALLTLVPTAGSQHKRYLCNGAATAACRPRPTKMWMLSRLAAPIVALAPVL